MTWTPRACCQGRSVAWCSVSNTNTSVPRGRVRASRFVASVVLRVKTTRSSSRAPTNCATSTRACSYHAEVTRLAYPLPRWTDEYVSSAVSTAALTLTSDGVDAAWSRLAYSTSPVRVGTRSPAPTTAGSSPGAALRTGSPSRTMRSLVGMVGAQYVYSVRAMDMWSSVGPGTCRSARSALADGVCQRPGRHPEHPTAEEGCWPASRSCALTLMTVLTRVATPSGPCPTGGQTSRDLRRRPVEGRSAPRTLGRV